jgi:hypothetical protein
MRNLRKRRNLLDSGCREVLIVTTFGIDWYA